jgi:hypothetical protein
MKTLNLVLFWCSFAPCVLSFQDGLEVTYKFRTARGRGGKVLRHRRATATGALAPINANPAKEQHDFMLAGTKANQHQATITRHDDEMTIEDKLLWDRILQEEGGSMIMTTPPTETIPPTPSPPTETTPPTPTPPIETSPPTTSPPAETSPPTPTPPIETSPPTACATKVNKQHKLVA